MWLKIVLCVLSGYAIGCVNPAYFLGLIKGFDIRKQGSGNAGASNAVIVLGAKAGVFSMLFDIAKAFLAVRLAPIVFSNVSFAMELAMVSVIAGHVFPFYMHFKGGKGLACLGGAFLGLDWRLFLVLLGVEFGLLFATNYLCFVPITACIVLPIADYIKFVVIQGLEERWIGSVILILATLIILGKHMKNIYRIVTGQEMHFSYAYASKEKKEAETLRISEARARVERKKQEKKLLREQLTDFSSIDSAE